MTTAGHMPHAIAARLKLGPDAAREAGLGLACAAIALAFMTWRYGPQTHNKIGDFTKIFYPTGRDALHGHLRYAVTSHYTAKDVAIYRYPPIDAVLLALFAWLPFKAAAIAWWAFGLVLMGVVSILMAFCLGRRLGQQVLVAGAVFLMLVMFGPFAVSVAQEFDIWIVALIAGAFALARDGAGDRQIFIAGVLLGVAASLKIYPFLTLLVIAVLRRREARLLLTGAACGVAACVVIPVLLLGVGPTRAYVHVLSTQGDPVLTGFPYAFGFLSIAYRALVVTPWAKGSAGFGPGPVKAVFLLFVVCVVVFSVRRLRLAAPSRAATWATALVVTAACSPFLEIQHLAPLVLIPFILATEQARRDLPPIILGSAVCSVIYALLYRSPYTAAYRPIEYLTVAVAVGVGYLLYRSEGLRHGCFGAAFVLLASPTFLNFSAYWTIPMSQWHVILGSFEYLLVIAVLVLMPRPTRGPRSVMTRRRARLA